MRPLVRRAKFAQQRQTAVRTAVIDEQDLPPVRRKFVDLLPNRPEKQSQSFRFVVHRHNQSHRLHRASPPRFRKRQSLLSLRYASMKFSISPSSTPAVLLVSTSVRRSFTI